MTAQVKVGYVNGTGSAINVSLGWIPDHVKVINLTDGDDYWENWLGKVIAFTSASVEPVAGDTLRGLTNTNVTGVVKQVILDTGTYAAGDAAGWLIFDADDLSGSFGSENAEINDSDTNDITVAVQDQDGIDIDTEVAATTTAATNIQAYVGSTTAAKGFTIGATISEDAKLLGYIATRNI
jgi:hypothetical protein